jgi:F-type H+-transporting ATPase subunit c
MIEFMCQHWVSFFEENDQMSQALKLMVVASAVVLSFAAPAMAAEGDALISFSGAFGAGLVMLGAAFGIARIGAAAVESMARQPEAAGDIRGGMIVAAALIEGATFFALIVCMVG